MRDNITNMAERGEGLESLETRTGGGPQLHYDAVQHAASKLTTPSRGPGGVCSRLPADSKSRSQGTSQLPVSSSFTDASQEYVVCTSERALSSVA